MEELYNEYEAPKKKELLDTPIIHGSAGDVVRGKFIEVVKQDGLEYVLVNPDGDGRPKIALLSPGFKDLFQRSEGEIQETFALENNLVYFTDADIKVEALAVLHPNGRVIWHVEPLLEKKLTEPIRGTEVEERYKKDIIPNLIAEKNAALEIRRSLGLIEVEGENGREQRYPRAKTPFEILEKAKEDIGGENYRSAVLELARTEKADRAIQKELGRLVALSEFQTKQQKEVPPQLSLDIDLLQAKSKEVTSEYVAAKERYSFAVKFFVQQEIKEKLKSSYKEIFKSEQELLIRRELADKHFTQALNSLRAAEALQRDFRALGDQYIEVERSANGMLIPASKLELQKKISEEHAKKREPVQQVALER